MTIIYKLLRKSWPGLTRLWPWIPKQWVVSLFSTSVNHILIKITFICFIVIHFGNSHKVKTWILSFTIASVQSWMKKMNKNNQSKWGANLEKIKYINFPTLSCFLLFFFFQSILFLSINMGRKGGGRRKGTTTDIHYMANRRSVFEWKETLQKKNTDTLL